MNLNNKILVRCNWFVLLAVNLLLLNGCKEHSSKQEATKNVGTDTLPKYAPSTEAKDSFGKADTLPEYDPLADVEGLSVKLEKIKLTGDTNAYDELSVAYFMAGDLHSFYYYSLLMANKYNYSRAYLYLYLALSEPYTGQGFEDLDRKTQRLALFYLLKSAELGDNNAKNVLEERFKDGKIPSSSLYSSLN